MSDQVQPPGSPNAPETGPPARPRLDRRALIGDIGVNVVAPYVTYLILSHRGVATAPALAAGAAFPLAATAFGLVRKRRVDTLAVIVLLASAIGIAGAVLFTSPDLLLAKSSFVTAGVGTAFLLSLAARRPLVFHLVSNTGQSAGGHERYAALWDEAPRFRWLMRRLSLIWGLALYAEASLRLMLLFTLPVAVFLPVSETMWIVFFAAMTAWSWRYGARQMQSVAS